MEKDELLSVIDNFSDDNSKKVFTFLVEYVSDIKEDMKGIRDAVKDLDKVSIINGGGDGIRTEIMANDFHQSMYNRIMKNEKDLLSLETKKQDKGMFKSTVKSVSWWADSIIKIILLIAIVLAYLEISDIYTIIQSLPH